MAIIKKKLGAKEILGGNVKNIVQGYCPNDLDSVRAYTLLGVVSGFETGVSTYGDWYAFKGDIKAINWITGEEMRGAKAFIPDPLQTMLLESLAGHESVEFALTVHVKRRDDLNEGYEYIVEAHKEAEESDTIKSLEKLIPGDFSRLEAPKSKKAPTKKEPAAKGGE